LLIVMVGIFLGTATQIFCGILIIYSSVLLQTAKHPFENERINRLESISLWSLMATLILSLAFASEANTSTGVIITLTLITLIINVVVFILFAYGLFMLKQEESEFFKAMVDKLNSKVVHASRRLTIGVADHSVDNSNSNVVMRTRGKSETKSAQMSPMGEDSSGL